MRVNHLELAENELRYKLTNFSAEQSVIGSVLINNACYKGLTTIKRDHFYFTQHQIIWSEIQRLFRAGQSVDIVTLSDVMERINVLDQCGGFAYLADLAKNTPSSANVSSYQSILVDLFQRRALVRVYFESIESVEDREKSPEVHGQNAVSSVDALLKTDGMGNDCITRHISELCDDWLVELEERYKGNGSSGITLGLSALDNMLAPKKVVGGSLFVVGARPKMGKTSLALKMVDHITTEHCGLVFSMEMTESQLVERSLVQVGQVPTSVMYPSASELSNQDEDLAKMTMTIGNLRERELYITTKPAVNLEEMERTIRHHYHLSGGRLKAVWVDYLTLMDVDQTGGRTDLPYARITQRLKVLAKELDLVVFLLVQLNRGLEQRMNKRPMPSDGRETGQIEQDCDYWLGIYRDHVYNPDADPTFTELLMRLNRHGKSGTAYAKFAGGRFEDWIGNAPVDSRNQREGLL